ncbi:MAG: ABC transporter substrate-binding protein [Actinomycetota bacterium]
MSKTLWSRLWALILALALVAAACGSDDGDDDAAEESSASASETAETEEESEEAMEDEESDEAMEDEEGDAMAAGSLADVCPSPLVVQTDWWAESEHGALYELIGEGYTVDIENRIVTGPLTIDGEHLGIDFEVRGGGPAIGFAPPRVQMYTDDSIHLGYSSTDSQSTAWEDLPLISVMAPLEINPQIVMWDADTYPEIESIADVGEAGIEINLFGTDGFPEAFVAQGIWTEDQLNPSYDGTPARFIAEGNIAQQGFASAEPYNYEFVFEEYGKAPAFELLHDAGWQVYSQTIGVKPTDFDELAPCLEQFIPVLQQSVVSFANDPSDGNAVIVDAVDQFNADWPYSAELAEWSVAKQLELGLIGNGPDDIVGNMEAGRIQAILDAQRDAGIEIPEDLTAEDMFTNEFIDESIGL